MSNKTEEKKSFKLGRNPITVLLALLIVFIIFISIFIPINIVHNKHLGEVKYFQDASDISTLKSIYDEDSVVYYDNYEDYNDFKVTLYATQYDDVLQDTFIEDDYNVKVEKTTTDSNGNETTTVSYENEYEGDAIKFKLKLELADGKTLSGYKTITSSYVVYASLSTATNWVADHSTLSSVIKFTTTSLENSIESNEYELRSKVSYPAKRTTCWPFSTTVDSPDVYLYIYYKDSKDKAHHAVIRYPYSTYRTSDTIGAIMKP